MCETALDCIQKLVLYGFLRGASPDKTDPSRTLMDTVVDTVCDCFDHPEDTVQLQILKALLAAITSPTCEVHDVSLLRAVRTCYNICLVSKNLVNQKVAKATLTQILHLIYHRMEMAHQKRQAAASLHSASSAKPLAVPTQIPQPLAGLPNHLPDSPPVASSPITTSEAIAAASPAELISAATALVSSDAGASGPGELTPAAPVRIALLGVDIQRDFFPEGALPIEGAGSVVDAVNSLRSSSPALFDVVMFARDSHPAQHVSFASSHLNKQQFDTVSVDGSGYEQLLWPDHCVQGTPGAELHDSLVMDGTELALLKGTSVDTDCYSAFCDNRGLHQTTAAQSLRDRSISAVFVCGLVAEHSVANSAVDALRAGFRVYIIADACRGLSAEATAAAIGRAEQSGVRLVNLADVPAVVASLRAETAKASKEKDRPTEAPAQWGQSPEGSPSPRQSPAPPATQPATPAGSVHPTSAAPAPAPEVAATATEAAAPSPSKEPVREYWNQHQHPRGKFGHCIVCGKTADNFCKQTRMPVCSVECKNANLKRLQLEPSVAPAQRSLPFRTQSNTTKAGVTADFGSEDKDEQTLFADIYQKDGYVVFRALCKQSLKQLPDSVAPDSIDMRSKILALEMLHIILENSGTLFASSEKFIQAIRQYLCLSLLKNGVSSSNTVFGLSLSIFLTLILKFRHHLKTEIGVFFTHVFLSLLESTNSTLHQKFMIVHIVLKICQDPPSIVDIFLNYDCDINAVDIFSRIADDMSKIARSIHVIDSSASPAQESAMRVRALECLVAIVKSLDDFCLDMQAQAQNAESSTNVADDDDTPSAPRPLQAKGSLAALVPVTSSAQFEKAKHLKLVIEEGIRLFNIKPSKGIKYLVSAGALQDSPKAFATFFQSTQGLDKTKLGEFLGEFDPKNIQTLYAYVDLMDFAGMVFDEGLRYFLRGFRLPGEAQKIDRMMEKFAEKYCKDNPGKFKSADTAYVMAYSVIMLNTDAHNPMVKNKMTKAEFLRNNRNIGDGEEMPQSFLEEIYDRIVGNEIKLKDDSGDPSQQHDHFLSPKKRQQLFLAEREKIINTTQKLIKERGGQQQQVYYRGREVQHIRPIFETCWYGMLAAFSQRLEHEDDPHVVQQCLAGFLYSVKISSLFYLETERNAFISALAKFTMLHTTAEIRAKNVESIKTLVRTAYLCGNNLQSSWYEVFKCVSELERLNLIGAGVRSEATVLGVSGENPERRGSVAKGGQKRGSTRLGNTTLDEINSQSLLAHLDRSTLDFDRIFTNSGKLNDDCIVHFIEQLCRVSKEEIDMPSPRIFCLQKLVEIAAYNMNRVRYVWTQIWNVMALHFRKVGCHHNLTVAMYAVDSLRQLAMKFLEKEELTNYHFQKEFLKPFEYVMTYNQMLKVRELCIRCLEQMIQSRASTIKSGWKSIFVVFSVASGDPDESIVRVSFDVMDRIVAQHFAIISEAIETFVDCVNCLVAYSNNTIYLDISVKSLKLLQYCAQELSVGHIRETIAAVAALNAHPAVAPAAASNTPASSSQAPPSDAVESPFAALRAQTQPRISDVAQETAAQRDADADDTESDISSELSDAPKFYYTDSDIHLQVWFPILTGLSRIVAHHRQEVRACALDVLFYLLRDDGHHFTPRLWELIFRGVLFPIFDDVRHATKREDNEWLQTTCKDALIALVGLWPIHFPSLLSLIDDMMVLFGHCLNQDNEFLPRIGVQVLRKFVLDTAPLLNTDTFALVCGHIARYYELTMPRGLEVFEITPEAVAAAEEVLRAKAGSVPHLEPAAAAAAAAAAVDTSHHLGATLPLPTEHRRPLSPNSTNSDSGSDVAQDAQPDVEPEESLLAAAVGAAVDVVGNSAGVQADSPAVSTLMSSAGDLSAALQPQSDAVSQPTVASPTAVSEQLEIAQPDTAQSDTVQPGTVQPDTVQPDTVQPDAVEPAVDSVQPAETQSAPAVESTSGASPIQSGQPAAVVEAAKVSVDLEAPTPRASDTLAPPIPGTRTRDGLSFQSIKANCVTQLLLIQATQEIIEHCFPYLSTRHLHTLMRALESSWRFASAFNGNLPLRHSLLLAGFMPQLPNLLRQETSGTQVWMRVLFWMYTDTAPVMPDPLRAGSVPSHFRFERRHDWAEGPLIQCSPSFSPDKKNYWPDADRSHAGIFAKLFKTLLFSRLVKLIRILRAGTW
eukprot:TRINITY_DN2179_c0_g1_i5.p1 TRINITY_DN2179_c0_g1~~TRINITY_DN2179_c0_g1_i5.p1  ORF type:complete len:2300 (+),score=531.60 TRINITY_DN2179_c0_g1_i5:376-6900(+)